MTPTKYIYQGGMSTVLTGGVMLGGSTKANLKQPASLPSVSKADDVSVYTPPHARLVPSADAESWRRGLASLRVNA